MPVRTSRVYWIDALKAMAIIFVVVGHTPGIQGYSNLVKYIYSFHIPLFFLISGVLFDYESVGKSLPSFLQKQTRTLLVPYFAWGLLTYIPWFMIARHFGSYPDLNPLKPLLGMLYGTGSGTWLIHNGALWFLPCLFVTRVIFFATIKCVPRSTLPIAFAVLMASGFICVRLVPFPLPWGLDLSLVAIGFFGAGFLLKDRLQSFQLPPATYLCGVLCILAIIHITFILSNARISFTERAFGDVILFLCEAYVGIAFWFLIAKLIPVSSIISLIGENTMMIFILHTFIFNQITGFAVFILRLPPTFKYESLPGAIVYTAIAVASSIALMALMRRLQPWIVGR
ncbi:MAG: acyltransferase family protein [Nitrospirota bacterium]